MRRTILLVGTWVAGTAVALGLSALAVRTVGQRLTDPPRRIADVAAPPTTATGAPVETAAPTPTGTSADTAPATTSATSAPAPGTAPSTPSGGAGTTSGGATTAATNAAVVPGTYRTQGGVVVVTCVGDAAGLAAASPAVGWTVDVRETGPERVEVRFELAGAAADSGEAGDDADDEALEAATQARVRASCADGVVDAEVR